MQINQRPEYKSKPKPLTFKPEALVAEAVSEMSRLNYGSVVVTNEAGEPVGLVTERDIMKRLVNEKRSPEETKLSDIMSTNIRVASGSDDVRDWLRIMSNERFRRLPVVDEKGRVEAVMTQGDFVSYTWPELFEQAKLMTKQTLSSNYQIVIIVTGVLIYSLATIFILRAL